MTVANVTGGSIQDTFLRNLILESEVRTLAGDITLSEKSPPVQLLDPGGATRVVTLPAEASSKGRVFIITNTADAAEDLTVKNDAATTIATVNGSTGGTSNQGEVFYCDGVAWYSLLAGTREVS